MHAEFFGARPSLDYVRLREFSDGERRTARAAILQSLRTSHGENPSEEQKIQLRLLESYTKSPEALAQHVEQAEDALGALQKKTRRTRWTLVKNALSFFCCRDCRPLQQYWVSEFDALVNAWLMDHTSLELQEMSQGKRSASEEEETLISYAEIATRVGMKAENTPADGDCFYHAVCDHLNNVGKPCDVRASLVGHLQEKAEYYASFVAAEPPAHSRGKKPRQAKPRNLQDEISDIQKGAFADELAIQAAADLYQLEIIIFSTDENRPPLIKTSESSQSTLYLLHDPKHVHYVRMSGEPNEERMEAIRRAKSTGRIAAAVLRT